jgi:hypothetical protein
MKRTFGTVLLLSALVVLALAIGILSHILPRQRQMLAALQREKMESDEVRSENAAVQGLRVDAAELIRLRGENTDLPKLRNQVRQLRGAIQGQDSQESEMLRQLRSENEELQRQQRDLQGLPNRATCIKNLELIGAAKKEWAQQNGLQIGEVVTMDVLAPFFPNGFPTCPDGGHYSVNRAGAPPMCSVAGHSIR